MSSTILFSRFSPCGEYIGLVSSSFDKQHISVKRVNSGHKDSDNELFLSVEGSGLKCRCLEWIKIGGSDLVGVGMSNGEIWLYCSASNQILQKLVTGDINAITGLCFSEDSVWCVSRNDFIYEFSLVDFSLLQKLQIKDCTNLCNVCIIDKKTLILASHTIFLVDIIEKNILRQFPGHLSAITNLSLIGGEYIMSSAQSDRFLNIYNLETGAAKAVLVAGSNITHMSHADDNVVAVVTEEGKVELFEDPLVSTGNKRRQKLSKKVSKMIKMEREGTDKLIPIFNCKITKNTISITWLEYASVPYFKQLQWESLDALHIVRHPFLAQANTIHKSDKAYNDVAAAKSYFEGNATVTSGDHFKHTQELINELERIELDDDSVFFESLQDKLSASFDAPTSKFAKKVLTSDTLTVVLSQALQSNDRSLLETVLNIQDKRVIQSTIIKLKPSLAVTLLERLAERIARNSHKQGLLNTWCKWCLIVHGGYLITIPNLILQLASLHSTLKKRGDLLSRLQVLEINLNCWLDVLDFERFTISTNSVADQEAQFIDSEALESDVEYNEELDDAGLIEDGELDHDYDSEKEEDIINSTEKTSNLYSEVNFKDDDKIRLAIDEEHGYSDVEML